MSRDWRILKRISRYLKIVVFMVFGLVALFVAATWYYWGASFRGQKFDPAIWRTTTDKFSEQKCKMSSDLVENYLKPGMTRKEVIALLGKPMEPTRPNSGSGYISYVLGTCGSLDIYTLDVFFDREGHLTQTFTVQH